MDYEETKKMDKFVGRIFEVTDLLEDMTTAAKWQMSSDKVWGMLDTLATSMMNEVKWDPKFMAEQEAIQF
jgi:hypothetical protein